MEYIIALVVTIVLSVIFTPIIRKIALKFDITDKPGKERKIHKKDIPFLGGVAVFLSFSIVLIYYSFFTELIVKDFIYAKHIWGILIASLTIIVGGILDDKYDLKPKIQILFPIIACVIIIFSGIGIDHIRNPFGGTLSFVQWEQVLFYWQGIPYKLTLMADVFTFIWLLGMMYTTKLLDGLDGLVSGVAVIGGLIIFGIAMSKIVTQPNTAIIAIILSGAFLGFLIFNFNPAKIFLGEGGSLFPGLMLGVLAIISGSKVATTLLIMGIPILDVGWVIIWRIKEGKHPFKTSDKKHLHFRLLDAGLSQRQVVLFLYCLTGLFGLAAVFLQSFGKMIALVILLLIMIILVLWLFYIYNKRKKITNN